MADTLAEDLVAAFNALFGDHEGLRAVHAKGTCCTATFTATPDAAALTRAPHMQGEAVGATVRFSNGSGDPAAHDAGREPRGMAIKLHLDERRSTDIVAINQPTFVVRTPEEVLEFLRLRKPDPETGQPDIQALIAFVAARPESQRAAQLLVSAPPVASFLETEYFALHAFRFVNAADEGRFGKYRITPDRGVRTLAPEEAEALSSDYLREELVTTVAAGSASFSMFIRLAADGDDPVDPTQEWTAGEEILAGRLEITGIVDDQDGGCEALLFDPTRLVDGIEASDDPVLNARPRAYAVSSKKRAKARR
ncbi:MAG TPA: catalase family peroxidase [Actinomycetota bacterium]|nr:catalase family peroxidase [Actinomycetota bacterium]